jgi:hypothetical protein
MSTVTSADGLGIPRGVRRVRQRQRWSGRGRRLIPTCRSSATDGERCCGARPPPASTTAVRRWTEAKWDRAVEAGEDSAGRCDPVQRGRQLIFIPNSNPGPQWLRRACLLLHLPQIPAYLGTLLGVHTACQAEQFLRAAKML